MRFKESRRKFLLGLAFEKAGLAIVKQTYLDSSSALSICKKLLSEINQNNGTEHIFYKTGETAFNSQSFMGKQDAIQQAQLLFRHEWKRIRYHNLVRLGGDIARSGLAEYPKATVLGGLLYYTKNLPSYLNQE